MTTTWLKKCLWVSLGLAWAAQTLAQGPSAVEMALAAINPDALSPREAMDALYQLKAMLKS